MGDPVPELRARAERCAEALREAESVLLASHIDADGLTSAGVAAQALSRAGIDFEATFAKQLDSEVIEAIAASEYGTVLFTDFGSGQLDLIAEHERAGAFTPVICDHHQPAEAETECHLNPLLEGINGASELSGAGASYVLARAMGNGHDNRDLAALAVVGAVGDMQASDGELHGANAGIVEEAVEAGVIDAGTDLALYGTQTRPLPKLLEYTGDLGIPGISNDAAGAIRFLDGLDLDLKGEEGWRCWVDLDGGERRQVVSALLRHAISRGVPSEKIETLVGTTYTLSAEEAGTELRDASEFSTLLNATARYDRADVGLAVCLGDRDGALSAARKLLREHRRNLSSGGSSGGGDRRHPRGAPPVVRCGDEDPGHDRRYRRGNGDGKRRDQLREADRRVRVEVGGGDEGIDSWHTRARPTGSRSLGGRRRGRPGGGGRRGRSRRGRGGDDPDGT